MEPLTIAIPPSSYAVPVVQQIKTEPIDALIPSIILPVRRPSAAEATTLFQGNVFVLVSFMSHMLPVVECISIGFLDFI